MYESDVETPQSTDLVDDQLDGIAGGIMDLLDDTDPNSSGVAEVKPPDPVAETEEGEPEAEAEPEAKDDEPEKYTIKWQGQEKEVTQEELLDLAQKGFDYTKKTQTLAEERDQLAPIMGLAKKIQSDPVLASTISAYLSGQPVRQVQQAQKPEFDDPIEQLKWEVRQETLAEVDKRLQQNLAPIVKQNALNQVKMQVQADPDFREVHQAIIDMVKAQPPAVQKTLFYQLDQDPVAYMETFNHIKQTMTKKPEVKPSPVKKETHAPVLEAGGVSPPDGIVAKEKAVRLSKQKAKALRSGDNFELARWLQDSGALEHLY